MNAIYALQAAGLLHLGLLAAGVTMPRVVNLHEHIRPLPEFIRRLFWVYYGFIAFCLIGFGLPAPAWALELGAFFLRTETELMIKSRRVVPGKLLAGNFVFDFPEFSRAVEDLK